LCGHKGEGREEPEGLSELRPDNESLMMISDRMRAKFFRFGTDWTQPDPARSSSVKVWDVKGVAMTIGIAKG